MKKEIAVSQASRLINCGMVILVTAGHKDQATITPCAWHLPLSKNPPLLGVALAKGHFSAQLIKESREFIVNIPPWPLRKKVIACGKCSGRDVDKFAQAELTRLKAHTLQAVPAIAQCLGHIECRLREAKETGDHFLFIGDIVYAQAEADCFKQGFWDTKTTEVIFHLGAKCFFKSAPHIEVQP